MCSKVVTPNSVIETFETLLSSAATILDEETGNPSWQPRADFYVYCILASLPWGGQELFEVTLISNCLVLSSYVNLQLWCCMRKWSVPSPDPVQAGATCSGLPFFCTCKGTIPLPLALTQQQSLLVKNSLWYCSINLPAHKKEMNIVLTC
jgi:hypothetical protein